MSKRLTKQGIAERIAALTRTDAGEALPIEDQAQLVAELIKGNTRDVLQDRLKAMTDPVDAPPTEQPDAEAAAEPGTDLATPVAQQVALLDRDRLELLRRTLASDLEDDEFAIFAAQCNLRRLDPFANQIHAVVRKSNDGKRRLTVQTGIDGFRVIADRTGCYAGSDEPVYEGEVEFGTGQNIGTAPMRASVTVRKIVQGQVFEVTRHAYWNEYYPGNGSEGFMYRKMPHTMLAKCAEAQAMRAAFPSDLSGLYADEEMMQADALEVASTVRTPGEQPTHDEASEVQRWRAGVQSAIDAAEPERVTDLKTRWGKVEPKLLPLKDIDNMRDMRRVVAVAKSALRVRDIHPADAVPEEQPSGAPAPVQDRDPREDTIDVPSTERVPSDESSGAGAVDPAPADEPAAGETTGAGEPAPGDEPLQCASGDGGFADDEQPVWSEDGKPYHAGCAPWL